MEWTGFSRANIFMEHSYCRPEEYVTSVTRCICYFEHDDGYMVCCDKCLVWQHVACVISDKNCMPKYFFCEICKPRKIDRHRAIEIQSKKRDVEEGAWAADDWSATETEDETTNGRRSSLENDCDKLFHSIKKPARPSPPSPDIAPVKRHLTRNQRNERASKNFKVDKKARSDLDKQLKNKKQPATSNQKNGKEASTFDSGLHRILEAISQNERTQKHKVEPVAGDLGLVNSYTSELQKLLSNIKYNQDGLSGSAQFELNNLNKSLCRVSHAVDNPDEFILEATEDLLANQPITEYVGKVMLRDQYREKWQPCILFYSQFGGLDLCVDATDFRSRARRVRRSCTPNAEIRHNLQGNSLRFFLHATKSIVSGSEITIGYDFNYHKCGFRVECACTRVSCPVARFQRKESTLKRSHNTRSSLESQHPASTQNSVTLDKKNVYKPALDGRCNDSSSSEQSPTSTVTLCAPKNLNPSPSVASKPKTTKAHVDAIQHNRQRAVLRSSAVKESDSERTDACNGNETWEEKENSQKKTREEKKLEAVVKVFEKMEKSELKRRGTPIKHRYKREVKKLQFREKNDEGCIDLLANAAAALASLAGDRATGDFHDRSTRTTETSTSSSSPDAFNANASILCASSLRRTSTSSSSRDPADRSTSSPASYLSDNNATRDDSASFSSPNNTHLDAATTLSLMSSVPQMQIPASNTNSPSASLNTTSSLATMALPNGGENDNHAEGAFAHVGQESKGCSAKKRWLNRAMITSQLSTDEDHLTPLKKRRLMRESLASEDADVSDANHSPEQKVSTAASPYRPVCESITDDESETPQTDVPGGVYCMPGGMMLSSFQNLTCAGLFGIQPTQPNYSTANAVIDPYQYYSSLNLLQGMAIPNTITTPFPYTGIGGTTPGGLAQSNPHVHSTPIPNGKPRDADEALPHTQEFIQSPYHLQQHFLQKNNHLLEAYFPLVNPLVVFPTGHQYPLAASGALQSLSHYSNEMACQEPNAAYANRSLVNGGGSQERTGPPSEGYEAKCCTSPKRTGPVYEPINSPSAPPDIGSCA